MDIKLKELESLCKGDKSIVTLLANASAFLNDCLDNINWIGFYLLEKDCLILGPFQGKVACEAISIGKGVCGTSFEKKMLLNVKNVHEFPGHIACDSRSNSELVAPLTYNGKCYGVLDCDSPLLSRFTYEDEEFLSQAALIISKSIYEILNK